MRQADSLWSRIVKVGGKCAARGVIGFGNAIATVNFYHWPSEVRELASTCDGPLDAAHVVPRRHRSVRWDPENGRPLCRAHHRYFTDHEKAWRDFIGPEWDRLWEAAQTPWDKNFPIAELTDALRRAKEAA